MTSDGKRKKWDVSGPHFGGWEIYHVKGSPADPDRIYASQSSGWFGQIIQRSSDGGKTWEPVGNKFAYDGVPGTHQWYDGTPHPWEFKRVWHFEPSLTDPDSVYAGVEDAAIFHSADGGQNWQELPGLRGHGSGPRWQPGAGGHVPAHDSARPKRPEANLHRDLGRRRLSQRRCRRDVEAHQPAASFRRTFPTRRPKSATACIASPCTARARTRCSCRSIGTSCAATTPAIRGAKSAGICRPISASPWTFTRTNPRPSMWFRSKAIRSIIRPRASCAYIAAVRGGNEWEPLTNGLPQSDCYVNVLRDAMAVDSLDSCGIYFGTTGGQVYASADAGDSWAPIVRDLPAVLSVEVQTLS